MSATITSIRIDSPWIDGRIIAHGAALVCVDVSGGD
jgi:hypothetical protein